MKEIAQLIINLFNDSSAIITRAVALNTTKWLILMLFISFVQYIVYVIWFKVNKKSSLSSVVLTLSAIICEAVVFMAIPTLIILIMLLATIDKEASLNDYWVSILLIYLFSAIASFGVLTLMGQNNYRKNYKGQKKFKKLRFKELLVLSFNDFTKLTLLIYSLISVGTLLFLPLPLKGMALIYIMTSFLVDIVGGIIARIKVDTMKSPQKTKKKRIKSSPKKNHYSSSRKKQIVS